MMLIQPRPFVPGGFPRRVFQSTLIDQLVSVWKMDESSAGVSAVTRSDSHGSNHLTDVGNRPSEAGIIGNAVRFDAAANHYLQCASNASLQTGNIDFEVNLWVYFYNIAGSSVIAGKTSAFGNVAGTEWFLGLDGSGKFFIRASDGSSFSARSYAAITPTTGVWYNVAAWHDSVSDVLGVQVNSSTVETTSYATGVAVNTSPFRVGTGSGAAGQTINAAVDEVCFWKRVLTSAERSNLYHGGIGLAYPFL